MRFKTVLVLVMMLSLSAAKAFAYGVSDEEKIETIAEGSGKSPAEVRDVISAEARRSGVSEKVYVEAMNVIYGKD